MMLDETIRRLSRNIRVAKFNKHLYVMRKELLGITYFGYVILPTSCFFFVRLNNGIFLYENLDLYLTSIEIYLVRHFFFYWLYHNILHEIF